jgi:hypothetical protein
MSKPQTPVSSPVMDREPRCRRCGKLLEALAHSLRALQGEEREPQLGTISP